MFADNTSIFLERSSYDKIIEELYGELIKVVVWLMSSNKLTLNAKNTYNMVYDRSRIKRKYHIILEGHKLEQIDTTKFLCII